MKGARQQRALYKKGGFLTIIAVRLDILVVIPSIPAVIPLLCWVRHISAALMRSTADIFPCTI